MSTETIDEAMLFAYVDGELDAAQRARVEAAVARDPRLAALLARQQRLRERLHEEFDAVLEEPVPERLLRAAAPASAKVVELRAVRESRTVRSPARRAWREWGAMAATLVLGLLVGSNLPRGAGGASLVADGEGLMATGPLAAALSDQLAGPVGGADASIGFSIRTAIGEYCRSFSLRSGTAGLACRRDDRWMVDVLATGQPGTAQESYRQAGSAMPEVMRAAIEERMVGEPLTEAGEAEQIGRRWNAERPALAPGR